MHNRLREFRERAGLTQHQLGELIGCGWQRVSRMERGDRALSQKWAVKAAAALGVHWATLMERPGAAGFAEPPRDPLAAAPPAEWQRLPEVSAALAAMLADIGVPLAPARLTALAQKALRDLSALDRRLPFADRLALTISEIRSRQLSILE